MTYERFEWLEIPEEAGQKKRKQRQDETHALLGKRCPQCGWLDEETATACFRCGYRYHADRTMTERIQALGVVLPERVFEQSQSLENFIRTHGRTRAPESPAVYRLRLQAQQLRLSRGFDQLICIDDLDLDHYEHQLDAALRALRDLRGRALLADEVGLGKTIEAGIIMKELIQRGLVQNVLTLTPASLTEQWREELETKFHEEFRIMEKPGDWRAVADDDHGRWIASLDRAKLKHHSEAILARSYDLVIIDEAHKLKNRSTQAWKFVNQLRKRYVLMLTATPIQNDLMELYSLITILSPGQLGTVRAFRRHFLAAGDTRTPKNERALRRLLNDVMIRNRRSKVDVQFPRRRAAIYHLTLSEAEWRLYADFSDYIRRRYKEAANDKALRLTLMILQRELTSSPQAVAGTLSKMVADRGYTEETRAELRTFLELAQSIKVGRKLLAVQEILAKFPGKFLIFTEFRRTQETIARQLGEWGVSSVLFHGGLSINQKEEAITAFRETDTRVLISTESGAEGRNLQFCHQLINYDLPWNPMRIEQRIGRLHRLGQEEDVTIFNLSCNETIEAHVIELLARKIRMFELVIGELDLILGNVQGAKSFEDLLRNAWESARSERDLQERIEAIGDVLLEARERYETVRERNMALDDMLEEAAG
ncbi:MAG: DEAD/DEAH box helicase family protein [Caldilineaceae bacterium]|nr:DEAD/DEAH box helicase family protein [Caldilineaceae bacterium]